MSKPKVVAYVMIDCEIGSEIEKETGLLLAPRLFTVLYVLEPKTRNKDIGLIHMWSYMNREISKQVGDYVSCILAYNKKDRGKIAKNLEECELEIRDLRDKVTKELIMAAIEGYVEGLTHAKQWLLESIKKELEKYETEVDRIHKKIGWEIADE